MRRPAGVELTVGDLMARGVEDVDAFCPSCGNMWTTAITFLPAATTLPKVAALMICPTFEGRGIEANLKPHDSRRNNQ